MPAPEEDIATCKMNFLKEQLMRLDTNLITISKTVGENRIKDYDPEDFDIKYVNEKFIAETTTSEMIDNRQNYGRSSDSKDRKNVAQKALKNAGVEKCQVEKIVKEISKIGPQCFKDILNYLKKRLDSKELSNLSYSSDKEVLGSLNKRVSEEIDCQCCSWNDKIKDDDEMTSVKEVLFSQNLTICDGDCTRDSGFFNSVDSKHKIKSTETVSGDFKTQNQSEVRNREVNKYRSRKSKNSDEIWIETLKNDDDGVVMKYTIDMIETEKNDSGDEKEEKKMLQEDVQEKQDVENAEKCIHILEYAECQDFDLMTYFDTLSEVSFEAMKMPSFLTSCFESVESDYLESFCPITLSLESYELFEENRLSLEWMIPRNVCYNCNIIAPFKESLPYILSDLTISYNCGLNSQTKESHLFEERKACNLIFSDTFNFNVCKVSFSNKCESKGVFDLCDQELRELDDSKSNNSSLNNQEEVVDGSYKKELEADVLSSCDDSNCDDHSEKMYDIIQDVKVPKWDFESIQKEEPEILCEGTRNVDDSYYQNDIGDKDVNDSFIKSENQEHKEIEDCCGELKTLKRNNAYYIGKHESIESGFGDLKESKNACDYTEKNEKIETDFGEVNDPENMNEFREAQEYYCWKFIGEMKYPNIREDNTIVQEKMIEDKFRDQNNQEHKNGKQILMLPENSENDGSNLDNLNNTELNQDEEQNLQGSCQRNNWKHVIPKTSDKKDNKKRQNNLAGKEFKRDKKKFEKNYKCVNKVTKCQNQITRSERKEKKRKQNNHVKLKHDKSAGKIEFDGRQMQYIQKNISKKGQFTQDISDAEGNCVHLNGDPPVRLHLVRAKVCSHSGGDSDHKSSRAGSGDGTQSNRNNSSSRDIGGAGGHSANGNGSNSDGNGSNNNNNNNRNNPGGNSGVQKSDSRNKNSKLKKTVNSNSTNLPENMASSPSLPPPKLDPVHVAERSSVEELRRIPNTHHPPAMDQLESMFTSNLSEILQASNESEVLFSGAQNLLSEEEEAPNIQHAAISIEQLCDTIGDATHGHLSGLDSFRSIDICLTRLIHDLQLAANEDKAAPLDSCTVCLVLSQLLIHMADPEHDGFVGSCEQCAQIFSLMMQHCIGCIRSCRKKSRLTQSDLCYKICKYLQWKEDLQSCNVSRLKSKVQKYCDKVLGSITNMVPLKYLDGEGSQVMGEMGVANMSDGLSSTNLSSSATLSLNGNIVTTETGDQEQAYVHHEDVQSSFGTATLPFANPHVLTMISSTAPVLPSSNAPAGSCGSESAGHMRLTRKHSQSRKTPAIPPPIVEENQPLEQGATAFANEGTKDDIENFIYQRWGSRIDDPYETQKTYGERNQYESVPLHNVHDVAQFLSVSTRPLGMPGIGEVVFGHPSQLRIVAGFWDKKREECERTQTCPYQHREEGVILADQKENFGILHTRYQKHHQWERVSHLGNGMSGKCHLAIDLKTNFKFCCKKIHLLRYAEEELSLWSEMHNAYIVRLYGAIRHGVKIYIFSEFIDGGSLAACIEEQKRLGRRLSHWSAINYFQQLLKVLAFLQKKNILHEDIKSDNILLRRNSTYLAVTDFGTSRRLQDPKELKNKSPVGSPTHWSPEKASMEGHGFPSDLWAAVCVLVHMLSGDPPWVKRFMKKAAILNFIIYARSPPMEDVPSNVQLVVRNLIERGFIKDPQARPSSSELLQHPAFSMLDEGTPETYFSTLTSMAHSGLPAVRYTTAAGEQQDVQKEELASNTLDPIPAEATVLFETKVPTGPYQESDSRSDHRNHKSQEILLNTNNDQTKASGKSQMEKDTGENDYEDESNDAKGVQTSSSGTPEKNNSTAQNSSVLSENDQTAQTIKMDSKVHQLVGPLDINKLLPQFNELFVSGDSINTQSIKSFFADVYSTSDLSDSRQSVLQVYRPEERTDEIPNLSIFDASWEAASQMSKEQRNATPASVPENENAILSLSHNDVAAGVTNPPFRPRFLESPALSQSPMHFTLSSESDDCTSADLFELEPAARYSDTIQNPNSYMDNQARNESSYSQKHNMYTPGDVSPTASSGSTLSSFGTSNLQQRKPTNLTLNVDCTPLPPVLSHSQSETQASSVASTNELEQKHRSNTWSQFSSAHIPHNSGSAPSSSHTTPAHRKANGTSVPSTASSGHSQFSYYRSSVQEEQERMIQELTMDILTAYSPTSSESEKSSYAEYLQQDSTINEKSELEENTDIQTAHKTLLDEIDETKLAGHNLKFYNGKGEHLFTMRIEELPMDWKRLITTVRQKITHYGYSHFSIHHMDNKPVKFRHPFSVRDFKVVGRQDPGKQCWCQQCQTMY